MATYTVTGRLTTSSTTDLTISAVCKSQEIHDITVKGDIQRYDGVKVREISITNPETFTVTDLNTFVVQLPRDINTERLNNFIYVAQLLYIAISRLAQQYDHIKRKWTTHASNIELHPNYREDIRIAWTAERAKQSTRGLQSTQTKGTGSPHTQSHSYRVIPKPPDFGLHGSVQAPLIEPNITPTDVTPTDVTPSDISPTDVTPTDVAPSDISPTDVTLLANALPSATTTSAYEQHLQWHTV
jgi:hypothetical protein